MSGIRITEYKGPPLLADPVNCPTCGKAWDYSTDVLGRLVAVHPVTKCVPPPVKAPDPAPEESEEYETRCEECRNWFVPRKYAAGSQVVCGGECRKIRRERKKDESYERGRLLIKRVA